MTNPWGPAQDEILTAMAAKGKSSRQMCEELGRQFGLEYTRNMVIGRCQRKGIDLGHRNRGGRPRAGAKPRDTVPRTFNRSVWGAGDRKRKPPTPIAPV